MKLCKTSAFSRAFSNAIIIIMIIIIFVVICMQSGCEKMIAMSDLDLIKLNL